MTDPRNSTKSARLPALALKMHKAAAALAGSRRARRCNPSRRARASSCQYSSAWIEPRQHIVTVVGSNSALVQGGWLKEGRRENDDETARRADFIVTNWRETVEQERQAGLFGPLERGVINSASQRRCDGSRSVIPPICRRLCECAIDCPPSNFRLLWEGIDGRQLSMRSVRGAPTRPRMG